MIINPARGYGCIMSVLMGVFIATPSFASCLPTGDRQPESYLPRTGSPSLAVLPVHASNITPPISREDIDQKFFGAKHSVRQYFLENSYGKLSLQGTVRDWMSLKQIDKHYEGACSLKPEYCVREILEEAVAAKAFEWEKFDYDNDSFVDVVVILHGEKDRDCAGALGKGNLRTFESKYSNMADGFLDTERTGVNGKPVYINEFIVVSAVSCDGHKAVDLGDIAHEIGHSLGLPDLEDRDGS